MVKKLIILCNSILVFFVMLFSINFWFDKQVDNFLYEDIKQVQILFNENYSKQEFLDFVDRYSEDNGISISQYTFPEKDKVLIYCSNPQIRARWNEQLFTTIKDLPKDRSNSTTDEDISYRVVTNNRFQVEIKPLKYIVNTGIGNSFYFSDIKKDTLSNLARFGQVKVIPESQMTRATVYKVNWGIVVIVLYLLVFLLLLLVINLYTRLDLISIKKSMGYQKWKIFIQEIFNLFPSILFTNIIISLLFLIVCFVKDFSNKSFNVIPIVVIGIISTFVFLIMCSTVNIFTYFIKSGFEYIRGKKASRYLLPFFYCFCFAAISGLIFSFNYSGHKYQEYSYEAESLKEFSKYKDVYMTNVTNQINRDDDLVEADYDNKVKGLYRDLSKQKDTFIITANNFSVVNGDPNNPIFLYQINANNEHDKIVSPYGRSIVVDANYIKKSNIQLAKAGKIEDILHSDKGNLTILVPEKYKQFEDEIKENYLKDYKFRMIEIENMLRSPQDGAVDEDSLSLSINIVYAKNNQKYFTFNTNYGSAREKYMIEDPIAIIFEDNLDGVFYGNLFTSGGGFYFYENSPNPYSSISDVLKKNDLGAVIDQTQSLYSQNGLALMNIKFQLINSIASIIILSILSIFMLSSFFRLLYKYYEEIYFLKNSLGYNFWERNIFSFITVIVMDVGLAVFTIMLNLSLGSEILLIGIVILGVVAIVFCDKKYSKYYFEKFTRGGSL